MNLDCNSGSGHTLTTLNAFGFYEHEIFPDDQGDVRRFINDFLAQGYSSGRIIKYLHTLVSIKKRLDKPFKRASIDDIKRFVGGLEKRDYAEWTKRLKQ